MPPSTPFPLHVDIHSPQVPNDLLVVADNQDHTHDHRDQQHYQPNHQLFVD